MKRHTKQNEVQKQGIYFTSNASELLKGFEYLVSGKHVLDPFAGNKDLVNWAMASGASNSSSYDLNPLSEDVIQNDSIMNPPPYNGKYLITNPPYLSKNKNKDKIPYLKWKQNDLYKCHLASLAPDLDEGIIILPSNFLSESNSLARNMFFENYTILKAKYYYYQVFPNATTGILVFAFKKAKTLERSFPIEIHYKDKIEEIQVNLLSKYGFLHGDDFFEYITDSNPLEIQKYDNASPRPPNTNIVISLLSYGSLPLGAHYNDGPPRCVPKSTFTTYQVSVPNVELTEDLQKEIVKRYNEVLGKYIKQYHGLFLANYMGAEQKIKSRKFSNLLLSRIIKETLMKGIGNEQDEF